MFDSYIFSVFTLSLFVLLIYIPLFKGIVRGLFSINVAFTDLIPVIFFPEFFNSLLLNYIYQKTYLDNFNILLFLLVIVFFHSLVLIPISFLIIKNIQQVSKKFFKVYISLFLSKMTIPLLIFMFYKYLS